MKETPDTLRRQFLRGATASTLLCALPAGAKTHFDAPPPGPRRPSITLEGTEFHLTLERTVVNVSGTEVIATTVNGMLPAPTLVWHEGDTVTIHVTNHLPVSSSIHWHGIILPYRMDGVPGITYDGIAPGETFTYRFTVRQNGTFWYHSHTGFQEQTGIHGSLVIRPKGIDPIKSDREHLLSLCDWSDENPDNIYRKIKLHSDYYNFNQRTFGDFITEAREEGLLEA